MQKKRNYHKSVHDREQYKRIVSFLSAVSLVALLTMVFAHTWYTYYADIIQLPFYRRGNWVVIAIYAVILFLFFKVYGGFKVGYLRRTDVLLSQILSVFGTNVLAYLQISLIARHFEAVRPVIVLTMKELVVLVLWTLLAQRLYFALYPPRRLIIVYGSPAAAALVTKMSYRVDKYMICESISAVKDYSMICDKILQYDGVIIHDIPAQMRNDLVKFCFDHKLRAYIVPNIPSPAKTFTLSVDATTTAIGNVSVSPAQQQAKIFSLDGRYVGLTTDSLQPGVYIKNSRKFIVK